MRSASGPIGWSKPEFLDKFMLNYDAKESISPPQAIAIPWTPWWMDAKKAEGWPSDHTMVVVELGSPELDGDTEIREELGV